MSLHSSSLLINLHQPQPQQQQQQHQRINIINNNIDDHNSHNGLNNLNNLNNDDNGCLKSQTYGIFLFFSFFSLIITYLPLDYSMKQPPHTSTTDQHCKGSNDHHPNWAQHVPVRGHYVSPSSTVHSPIASLTQWT